MNSLKQQFLKHSRGFTLLEALIALLVLSIGLLGLAGLQVTGARFGHDAYVRSQSTLVVSDIIDRIRIQMGRINDLSNQKDIISQYASTTPATSCDPGVVSVANDLACWQESISDLLPQGSGTIGDNDDGSFDVTISWYDRDGEATRSYTWTFITGA